MNAFMYTSIYISVLARFNTWTYNVIIQYYFVFPIQLLTEPLVDLSSFTTEAVQAFLEYLYTAKCCVPINEHIKMELSTLTEM